MSARRWPSNQPFRGARESLLEMSPMRRLGTGICSRMAPASGENAGIPTAPLQTNGSVVHMQDA